MRKIVDLNQDLCVGCNRCVRQCPIETANLTYLDDQGKVKVRVDDTKCIACGACVVVCKHNARFYRDDTDLFLDDLSRGLPISLIVAPSIRSNEPEWPRLLAWFRERGVTAIYDASLGADICIWAHLRYMESHRPDSLIAQPCPAIVSFCERHRHELLENLSPVHSPMACTALYMRRYEGVTGRIAALSPCIAKANEYDETGLIQYSITYAKLYAYFEENGVEFPADGANFDRHETRLGSLFPAPGGFRENIAFFMGDGIRVDKSEGRGVYANLEAYAQTPKDVRPQIFDVLNCAEGCNMGPGCRQGRSVFHIAGAMDASRKASAREHDRAYYEALQTRYDEAFRAEDFLREYNPVEVPRTEVSEAEIANAFELMDKDTYAKQNFDCGACGSDSCREMARRIALGLNIPLSCIVKSRDDAEREHRKNAELYRKNADYIDFVQKIGLYLSSMEQGNYAVSISGVLENLCATMKADAAYLWRDGPNEANRCCTRFAGWSSEAGSVPDRLSCEWLPDWMDPLFRGEWVSKTEEQMTPHEKQVLAGMKQGSILTVPIVVRGTFWGFVAVHNADARAFTDEEIAVVSSSGILIASSIIEREMTESLITAREEALAGTRAKSGFLSRMSHEMRTPMNAIIGMTKIAGGTDDMEKLRHCLGAIDLSSRHLLGIINDVLDMSKIEAGKFELDIIPFDMNRMFAKTVGLVADKAEEKGQHMAVETSPEMHMHYLGDELRLSQVLLNLLSNAVKFTPHGGHVLLSASECPRCGDTDLVSFRVSDTGIGMSEEQMSRLFSAFEQADSSIGKRFGGTGLGLAISKNIIEKMGGRIWVESKQERGSTFFVEVPLVRAEPPGDEALSAPAPAPEETSEAYADFSDVTLLLAEDIEINREIFMALLEETGVTIDVARDGVEAVRSFRENPGRYDLIIMDIQMPVMDGYQATRAIRALGTEEASRIPIIAMTANAFREDIDKCIESGMNDHLAKPIDERAVIEKIAWYTRSG